MSEIEDKDGYEYAFPQSFEQWGGLLLRDYFAAKAMQGILAAVGLPISIDEDRVSEKAYKMADAMIQARKQNANE